MPHTDSALLDVLTFDKYTTPLGELATDRYLAQYNHTISASEEWPDSLRWKTTETASGTVSKAGNNEGVLQTGTTGTAVAAVQTREYGHYPPGSEAIPGVAVRLHTNPTGNQDARWGYFDGQDGMGFGTRIFQNGETTAGGTITTTGLQPYAFTQKSGTTSIYAQEHWNLDTLDGSSNEENPSGHDLRDFSELTICRFPHLYYGGGRIRWAVKVHDRSGDAPQAPLIEVHTVAAETEAPIDTPHLPSQARVENNGTTTNNLDLRLTAAHYVTGDTEPDTRVNGVRNSVAGISTTEFVPIISWRKRTGWEAVNVRPVKIAVQAGTDMELMLVEDASLTGASFGLAPWTDSSESAVYYDTSATSMTQNVGNRRWVGQVTGGQGNKSGDNVADDIDFNLPSTQIVTLAARADTSGDIKAVVMNGEEF